MDKRVLKLIRACQKAGAMENSVITRDERGTPQGSDDRSRMNREVFTYGSVRALGEIPFSYSTERSVADLISYLLLGYRR